MNDYTVSFEFSVVIQHANSCCIYFLLIFIQFRFLYNANTTGYVKSLLWSRRRFGAIRLQAFACTSDGLVLGYHLASSGTNELNIMKNVPKSCPFLLSVMLIAAFWKSTSACSWNVAVFCCVWVHCYTLCTLFNYKWSFVCVSDKMLIYLNSLPAPFTPIISI